jgi:hypothetical protein
MTRQIAIHSRRSAYIARVVVFGERITATEWLGIASIGIGLVILSVPAWLEGRRGQRESIETAAIETG